MSRRSCQLALVDDEDEIAAPTRILVADDFDEWRVQVAHILRQRPEWQIISEADDGVHAVQSAAELHPDIVLLDIQMPGLDGIKAALKIRQNSPNSRIIFVTQFDDNEIMTAALDAGAKGYVLKMNAASQLVSTIASALRDAH